MKKTTTLTVLTIALVGVTGCGDDTSDALSAFCDSQESVLENLRSLQALDPTTDTIDDYRAAASDLDESLAELRTARSDLVEQDVANVESAWQALDDELSSIEAPLSEAGEPVRAAIAEQIGELAALYDAAYANSSCSE